LDSTLAGYNAARDIYNTNLAGQNQRYSQGRDTWNAEKERQGQLGDQTLGEGQIDASRYGSELSAAAQQAAAASSAAASKYAAELNYNLGLAQQQQSAQNQAWNQALTEYQLPMNTASGWQGLVAGNPQPAFQGFGGATGYNPASLSNAAQNTYNSQMGAANASNAKKNNTMQTGATLGGAALMSDMSLKENIKPLVGEDALNAIMRMGGYSFDWKDDTGHDIGVMAQEVQRVLPELVVRAETGHLMVNYTGIVALAVEAIKYLAEKKS
jgi:hypothetical protein